MTMGPGDNMKESPGKGCGWNAEGTPVILAPLPCALCSPVSPPPCPALSAAHLRMASASIARSLGRCLSSSSLSASL